jgi:hypothetical protein
VHPAVPAAWRGTQLVTPGLIFDWQTDRARRRQAQVHVEEQGAAKTLNALEKVVKAVKVPAKVRSLFSASSSSS